MFTKTAITYETYHTAPQHNNFIVKARDSKCLQSISKMSGWDLPAPSELAEQHFEDPNPEPAGSEVLYPPPTEPGHHHHNPPYPYWLQPIRRGGNESGLSAVRNEHEKFSILLDVRHFSPDEIKVTTVGHTVKIEGKHEEQVDEHGGMVARQFNRKYMLPKEVDPETVTSTLNHEGILTVQAPKFIDANETPLERPVPIQLTQSTLNTTESGEFKTNF